MPIEKDQYVALLSELRPEDIGRLYRRTVNAVTTIAISYILGVISFTVMFMLKMEYSYLAVMFPLLGYVWLISYGARYANNRYGFKKTPYGIIVYIKKRENYSTSIAVHIVIFLFSALARMLYEIRNMTLIRQEIHKKESCLPD